MKIRIFIIAVMMVSVSLNAKSTTVICKTTKGPVEIVVKPEWSPKGAERFLQLVDDGFYNHLPLFRCMDAFLCQFGAKPNSTKTYPTIADDLPKPDLRKFKPGFVSFAGFGPNSRSTHAFIALAAVPSLGTQPWETPLGYVTEQSFKKTVKHFYTGYGDSLPNGHGPSPQKIEAHDGEDYLKAGFPQLDWFQSCKRK